MVLQQPADISLEILEKSAEVIRATHQESIRKGEKETDEEPTDLLEKKQGWPLLLGDTVDAQLQVYLKMVRDQGGAVAALML